MGDKVNTLNLTIQKNATFIYPIVVWSDNKLTRKDFTGYTADLKIKRKLPNGELETTSIIELNTENGGISLGGTEGTIDLFISATDTGLLPSVNAFYNLRLINGEIIDIVLSGNVIIKDGASIC